MKTMHVKIRSRSNPIQPSNNTQQARGCLKPTGHDLMQVSEHDMMDMLKGHAGFHTWRLQAAAGQRQLVAQQPSRLSLFLARLPGPLPLPAMHQSPAASMTPHINSHKRSVWWKHFEGYETVLSLDG